jgi:hypothetical protein
LEKEIENLIGIGGEIEFLEVKPLLDQLRRLDASVKQIVNHPVVLDRAACKLKNSHNEVPVDKLAKDYPLTVLPRLLKTIDNNYSKMLKEPSSKFESADDLRREIHTTLTKSRESTFDYHTAKQITPAATVSETLEYQKKYKNENITKLKAIQNTIKPQLGTGDTRAKELNGQCNQAIKMLEELYNEVQIKAKSAEVVAVGVKNQLAIQAMSPDYDKTLVEHNKKQQFIKDAPELLKTTTDLSEIDKINKQVAQFKLDTDKFEHVKYTRDAIEKAHEQGLPVIAHMA